MALKSFGLPQPAVQTPYVHSFEAAEGANGTTMFIESGYLPTEEPDTEGVVTGTASSGSLSYVDPTLDGLANDDLVIASNISADITSVVGTRAYHVVNLDATANTLGIAATQGGSDIVINANGTFTLTKVERYVLRAIEVEILIGESGSTFRHRELHLPIRDDQDALIAYATARADLLLASPTLPYQITDWRTSAVPVPLADRYAEAELS